MFKQVAVIAVIVLLFGSGCKEQMVGAPCIPETDNGSVNVDISGKTWSIETGSVQCATRICLTQVRTNPQASGSRKETCKANPTLENCWTREENGEVVEGPVQLKFSFCSCRCRDADGNTNSTNPDKYDDLCPCPPSTICEEVMDPIEGVSDKLFGGYCVPNCIANPCDNIDGIEICTPSKSSEEPWKWFCDEIPPGLDG